MKSFLFSTTNKTFLKGNLKTFALALAATLLCSLNATAQWTSNTGSVFLATAHADKNVGIGTNAPNKKLHVNGGLRVEKEVSVGSSGAFEVDAPNAVGGRFKIATSGNVGIGTSSPTNAKLQFGNVLGNKITLFESSTGVAYGFGINDNNLSTYIPSGARFSVRTNGYNGTEKLVVTSEGHVGIGASSPAWPLDVRSTGGGQVRLGTTTLPGYQLWAGGAFNIVDVATDQIRFSIRDNGSIGIGTTAPSSKLHVAGDIRCFNLFTNSDRRYKTGIRTLEGALGKVLAMRGASYDLAAEQLPADYTAGKQVGFIAQEMQAVMPELVKTDAEGTMSVNYIGVIPVLVEALKEQHEVIAEKETRIAALEAQNADLQARLARIEAALNIATDRQPLTAKAAAVTATISPNPTSGLVTVSLSNTASAKSVTVKIMDSTGREVASQSAAGKSSVQIDLSQLPAGLYVAQVLADGNMVSASKVQLVK